MLNLNKNNIIIFLYNFFIAFQILNYELICIVLYQTLQVNEKKSGYTLITSKKAEGLIISEINFEGNSREQIDDVIENNLDLNENEPFGSEKLQALCRI